MSEFLLDDAGCGAIGAHLEALGWCSVRRIGDGNMNRTVRVRGPHGSYILKQSRPYCVKYPQIPAPVERAAVEAAFYRIVAGYSAVAGAMPRLLEFDAESNLLCLEDLGDVGDLMGLYRTGELTADTCRELVAYLRALHAIPIAEPGLLVNRAMRKLNFDYQYDLPMRSEAARGLRSNALYAQRIVELGELYLADGAHLLHGDFFPGSWLVSAAGVKVIDPEFCFLGPREYDLGIFLAHLVFIRGEHLWDLVWAEYGADVDWELARRFAGAELMRRLIGVAQLPLAADDDTKAVWLRKSEELVCAD